MSAVTSRRNFLKLTWGVLGVAAVAEAGAVSYLFLSPRATAGEFGGVFTAGAADEFPPGSVTPFTAGRFYLVREDDGGFVALYRKCTHLGCAVPWEPAVGQFVCPCHASAFERNGELINAPAPRPLDRFAVTIVDGVVLVDTGVAIQRDHTSTDDLVYA